MISALPFAFSESDGRASLCCKRHPSIYTIAFLVGFEKHSPSVTSNMAKCNQDESGAFQLLAKFYLSLPSQWTGSKGGMAITASKGTLASILKVVWEAECHSGIQDDLSHRTSSLCVPVSPLQGFCKPYQKSALGPVMLRNWKCQMTLHFGMDSEFENTKISVQKIRGTIWELSSYCTQRICYTQTYTCTCNLKTGFVFKLI